MRVVTFLISWTILKNDSLSQAGIYAATSQTFKLLLFLRPHKNINHQSHSNLLRLFQIEGLWFKHHHALGHSTYTYRPVASPRQNTVAKPSQSLTWLCFTETGRGQRVLLLLSKQHCLPNVLKLPVVSDSSCCPVHQASLVHPSRLTMCCLELLLNRPGSLLHYTFIW